jgi:hypothetical protein
MPRESVLNAVERSQIRIEKLIFHIILKNELQPRYLNEVTMTAEQRNFFRDRLEDAASGRQFVFLDDSATKAKSEELVNCDNERFVQLSKELAADFKRQHGANANDGVFIVSVASIGARKLIFLIKFDHKKIYQYKVQDGGRALLTEVQDTFSEDKNSIQKVALIDVSDNVVWDVLVTDLTARPEKDYITDYFKSFLGVIPRETDTDLTKRALSIAFKWAVSNQDDLPEMQETSDYKSRAKAYLLGNDTFDSDAFINSVILDGDAERRERHRTSFKQMMEDDGIYGQHFSLIHSALKRSTTKNIRLTREGVKIEWEGSADDVNYSVSEKDENGQQTITIKTGEITQLQ